MPDSSYYAISLKSQSLKTEEIECAKVRINNSDRPLEIMNDEGKVIFFVDNLGANVHTFNSTTSFVELFDTPKLLGNENSLLGIKDEKMSFLDEIKISKIEAEALTSKDITSTTINATGIMSDSIINAKMVSDDIKATTINTNLLTADSIVCQKMKIAKFETDMITGKESMINEANIESLICNTLVNEELTSDIITVQELVNKTGNITYLESQSIDSKQIKSDDIHAVTGDITGLTCVKMYGRLIDAKEIKTDKLIINKSVYGNVEEPLNLAVTQIKSVDVSGENIKITTKIPSGVLTQSIIINGLEIDGDYTVNLALNKMNDCTHTLICYGNQHILRITYKERVDRDVLLKILIQKI
tara:strand:- start:3481 stop:4554 length:1074 start_codon:yes stop_codon:yes gene_type:complete